MLLGVLWVFHSSETNVYPQVTRGTCYSQTVHFVNVSPRNLAVPAEAENREEHLVMNLMASLKQQQDYARKSFDEFLRISLELKQVL